MKPAELVRAADFEVQSVPTHGEVIRFLRCHHYARGGPNTSTYRHGMYRSDPTMRPFVGELVGVTLWIPPTRRALSPWPARDGRVCSPYPASPSLRKSVPTAHRSCSVGPCG